MYNKDKVIFLAQELVVSFSLLEWFKYGYKTFKVEMLFSDFLIASI